MKKTMLLLFLSTLQLCAQDLNPFEKNGKFGFKKNGSEIIPATFEYVCNFTDGLALVKSKGFWGFIDSTGQWKIPAVYDKSEPFFNGLAMAVLKGKMGMIDSEGKILIKPEFDKISEDYYGYRLTNGKLTGMCSRSGEETVPAYYIDLKFLGEGYINAQKEDKLWDFYHKGKLLVEKMDKPAEYVLMYKPIFKVHKNGAAGAYDVEKKEWIVPAAYSNITTLDFPPYTIADKSYNYIMVLHGEDALEFDKIYDPELDGAVKFAKANGELISAEQFTNFNSYVDPDLMDCKACIIANTITKTFVIQNDLKILEFDYNALKPQLSWFIGDGKTDYILNNKLEIMDSFLTVSPYKEFDIESDFGYELEPNYIEVNHEPFLIVSNEIEGSLKSAIYDLEEGKKITDWYPEGTFTIERTAISNYPLYIYASASGQKGYYTKGMKTGTPTVYERCETLGGMLITQKNGESLTEVFLWRNDSLIKVLEAPLVFSSSLLNATFNDVSPEGEPIVFSHDFVFTQNDIGQYGIISYNGKFRGYYDQILPNQTAFGAITTEKAGKYGAINLYTGNEIQPISNQTLVLNYLGESPEYYAIIDSGSNAYYLNSTGKKFYALNPGISVFKENGLYGLKSNSDFTNRNEIIVKPVYKQVIKDSLSSYFIVKNKEKKYGMINIYGDTLVPLKYSYIKNSGQYNYYLGQTFVVKSGKKVGLYSERIGMIIPTIYDDIKAFSGNLYFNTFIAESKRKKALYSSKVLLFQGEFDEIEYHNDLENYNQYFFTGKKAGKYYVQPAVLLESGFIVESPLTGPYDVVSGNFGFNKAGDEYKKYQLVSGDFLGTVKGISAEYSNGYFTISLKNGRWGALDLNGNELIPFIYESASFMVYRQEVMIGIENGITYYIYVDTNERYTEDQW